MTEDCNRSVRPRSFELRPDLAHILFHIGDSQADVEGIEGLKVAHDVLQIFADLPDSQTFALRPRQNGIVEQPLFCGLGKRFFEQLRIAFLIGTQGLDNGVIRLVGR